MKAIILAAGQGERLRPLTNEMPKCLVPYQGRPLVSYQIEILKEFSIDPIVLVKGYMAEKVSIPGTLSIVNEAYSRTNMVSTFFCAQEHFDDDIIVSYGDIIYDRTILQALVDAEESFSVAVSSNWKELWQERMEDPLSDAETMKINADGYIVELGKKPQSYAEIEGQYMGLFKIKKAILPKITKFYHSLSHNKLYDGKDFHNMYMTTFIQLLINHGFAAKAIRVDGAWLEVDSPADLNISCNFI